MGDVEHKCVSVDDPAAFQVMAAIGEIEFMERMKNLMPMVAAALIKQGVKFPKGGSDK